MTKPRRPAACTRRVAWLAGAVYRRSKRNVPLAELGRRRACYFGYSKAWALFEDGERVGKTHSSVSAAAFLVLQ